MVHRVNSIFQKYKYTGKELDLTHGLNTYDHGARQNYSLLGVWDRFDPLAEKYYGISPYVSCLNNPLNINDIDGKKILFKGDIEGELDLLRHTVPSTMRDFIQSTNGLLNIDLLEEGIGTMKEVPTNLRTLWEIAKDDRIVEISLLEQPDAVNIDGEISNSMVWKTSEFKEPIETPTCSVLGGWEVDGAVSLTLAPISHHWTEFDLKQRSLIPIKERQFSSDKNYQVQINLHLLDHQERHIIMQ